MNGELEQHRTRVDIDVDIDVDVGYQIVSPILGHLWEEYSQTPEGDTDDGDDVHREELEVARDVRNVEDARKSFRRCLKQMRQWSFNLETLETEPSMMKDLDKLIATTYNLMRQQAKANDSRSLRAVRQIYTDSCILLSIGDILRFKSPLAPTHPPAESSNTNNTQSRSGSGNAFMEVSMERQWMASIRRLDCAIVFSGAPGLFRMDWIQSLIQFIQQNKLDNVSVVIDTSKLPYTTSSSASNNASARPKVGSLGQHSASPSRDDRIYHTSNKSTTNIEQTIQSLYGVHAVPVVESEPDLITFLTRLSKSPFVIRGGVSHWPALGSTKSAHTASDNESVDEETDGDDAKDDGIGDGDGGQDGKSGKTGEYGTTRAWGSNEYLRAVAGRGRVVPVEIGKDYRVDEWSQEMMNWETFLQKIEVERWSTDSQPSHSSFKSEKLPVSENYPDAPTKPRSSWRANPGANPDEIDEAIVYLAQYSLFKQFPKLRDDIVVPDLVYYAPSSDYPNYRPPQTEDENDEGTIINAWLGPGCTVSPAHTVCISYTVEYLISFYVPFPSFTILTGPLFQLLWYVKNYKCIVHL
jgi:lysine-specific demethylase 8